MWNTKLNLAKDANFLVHMCKWSWVWRSPAQNDVDKRGSRLYPWGRQRWGGVCGGRGRGHEFVTLTGSQRIPLLFWNRSVFMSATWNWLEEAPGYPAVHLAAHTDCAPQLHGWSESLINLLEWLLLASLWGACYRLAFFFGEESTNAPRLSGLRLHASLELGPKRTLKVLAHLPIPEHAFIYLWEELF